MKFHRACRGTLTLLFFSGLYLPVLHKLVKKECLRALSRAFGRIMWLAVPFYSMSWVFPFFDPGGSTLDKVFSFLAGLVCFSIVFKLYLFNRNVSRFEELIKIWDEMNEGSLYPQLREEMLLKRKKTTDIWSIGFGVFLVSVMTSTSVIPFFSRKLEHPTAFPYSGESPEFEILCAFELIMSSSTCFLVNGYNCFLMQIIAFEDVMCNYLKQTLAYIMGSLNVNDGGIIFYDTKYSSTGKGVDMRKLVTYGEICGDIENKLRVWINLHQKLIRYNAVVKEIYQSSLCVDYIGLIFMVGLIVFLFVGGSLTAALVFNCFAYSTTAYTIFYVTCHYGDLTELASENMFRDAFDGCWYLYSPKIRNAYLFIMVRCRKPLTLKALDIYPLNSRSFGMIFHHSYTFLMFLLQLTKRSE